MLNELVDLRPDYDDFSPPIERDESHYSGLSKPARWLLEYFEEQGEVRKGLDRMAEVLFELYPTKSIVFRLRAAQRALKELEEGGRLWVTPGNPATQTPNVYRVAGVAERLSAARIGRARRALNRNVNWQGQRQAGIR